MPQMKAKTDYTFTVFTATYNRKEKIKNVYASLKSQTFKDFEWVVVDDGSKDNTEELFETWVEESPFPITYIKKENGGKHTAFNRGVQQAKGELFLNFDSDDTCVPEALQVFYEAWNSIDEKEAYSGVSANCMKKDGRIVGTPFPEDVFDSNSTDIRMIHKVKGDKWGFQRVDILLAHPFPEPEGLKLVPEGIIWRKIGQQYKTRYINKNLRIYVQSEDSYTVQSPSKYAAPRILAIKDLFNTSLKKYFKHDPGKFIKSAIQYVRSSLHAKNKSFLSFENFSSKMLVVAAFPAGLLLYLMDLVKYRK